MKYKIGDIVISELYKQSHTAMVVAYTNDSRYPYICTTPKSFGLNLNNAHKISTSIKLQYKFYSYQETELCKL